MFQFGAPLGEQIKILGVPERPNVDSTLRAGILAARVQSGALSSKQLISEFQSLVQKSPEAAAQLLLLWNHTPLEQHEELNVAIGADAEKTNKELTRTARAFQRSATGRAALKALLTSPAEQANREQTELALNLVSQLARVKEAIANNAIPPIQRNAQWQRLDTTSMLEAGVRMMSHLNDPERKVILDRFSFLSTYVTGTSPAAIFGSNRDLSDEREVATIALDKLSTRPQIAAALAYLTFRDLKERRALKSAISNATSGDNLIRSDSFERRRSAADSVTEFFGWEGERFTKNETERKQLLAEFDKRWAPKLGFNSFSEAVKALFSARESALRFHGEPGEETIRTEIREHVASATLLERANEAKRTAKWLASIKSPGELLEEVSLVLQRNPQSHQARIAMAYRLISGRSLILDVQDAAFAGTAPNAPAELTTALKEATPFLTAQGFLKGSMQRAIDRAGRDEQTATLVDAAVETPRLLDALSHALTNDERLSTLSAFMRNRSPQSIAAINRMVSFEWPLAKDLADCITAISETRGFTPDRSSMEWIQTALRGDKKAMDLHRLFLISQSLIASRNGTAGMETAERSFLLKELRDVLDANIGGAHSFARDFDSQWLPKLNFSGEPPKPKLLSPFLHPQQPKIPRNLGEVLEYVTEYSDRVFHNAENSSISSFKEALRPKTGQ